MHEYASFRIFKIQVKRTGYAVLESLVADDRHTAGCRALQGNYKWLLYGDDDTVFFPEGVARAIKSMDAELPHFVSGEPATATEGLACCIIRCEEPCPYQVL